MDMARFPQAVAGETDLSSALSPSRCFHGVAIRALLVGTRRGSVADEIEDSECCEVLGAGPAPIAPGSIPGASTTKSTDLRILKTIRKSVEWT
jgi:hypothetical protein